MSDVDSTPTQVRYSVDPVFSGNADDYTWLTWDQLQALEPSRRTVTAVELVSEFSALDEDTLTLAATNGTINLRTKGNRPDDTYVMWVGTPQFSHPDDGVQTRTRSYYNQLLDVTGTRSYRAVLDKARDDSGPIQVRISDAVGRVDFGYAAPDPKVHVDKTTQAYDCNDERCTVGWDVVVDNAGTETLPAGSTVCDRMSADVTAVRASIGTQTQDDPFLTRFSQISTGPEYTLALDQDGHIWSWGLSTVS